MSLPKTSNLHDLVKWLLGIRSWKRMIQYRSYGSYCQHTECMKIVKLLQELYSIVYAGITIDSEESAMFDILTLFRQGCTLLPTLFNVVDCSVLHSQTTATVGIYKCGTFKVMVNITTTYMHTYTCT